MINVSFSIIFDDGSNFLQKQKIKLEKSEKNSIIKLNQKKNKQKFTFFSKDSLSLVTSGIFFVFIQFLLPSMT